MDKRNRFWELKRRKKEELNKLLNNDLYWAIIFDRLVRAKISSTAKCPLSAVIFHLSTSVPMESKLLLIPTSEGYNISWKTMPLPAV